MDVVKTETLKIRNTIYKAIDDYFGAKGFIEVSPPILTPFSCENACVGGSDLISVGFYGRHAYLSQSGQLYLESLAMQLGSVYCISPTFRAESSALESHLSEFWMCEAEVANVDFNGLIDSASGLIVAILWRVLKDNRDELLAMGADVPNLERNCREPIPRVTYEEAVGLLRGLSCDIQYGDDFTEADERALTDEVFDHAPVVITHFPKSLSSFYKKEDRSNAAVTLSFDIIAPNGGHEILGSSIRENDADKLRASLSAEGADLSTFDWYLDLIESVPIEHGGFGLGIERVVSWICSLSSIEDSVPFPRTKDRLWP